MKFILLLLVIIGLVSCQTYTAWTAQCIVTSQQMGSGYFQATVKYDWTDGMIQVSFANASAYTEFYTFNTDKGYNQKVLTGQFTYQYVYKTSTVCPCETNGLQVAMPAWFPAAVNENDPNINIPYWVNPTAGDTSLANGVVATNYYVNTGFQVTTNGIPPIQKSYTISNNFWLKNGVPAGFELTDPDNQQIRVFTITSITDASSNPSSLGLSVPTKSCPCSKQIDVVLTLDRSGSISIAQWDLEYAFVQNVTQNFQYGPLAVNLGIVDWNANQWTTIELTSGISASNVDSAVAAMSCCPNTASPSCCCCGTPIGGGIWLGGNMLATGRPKATKVLILLTDGCQNHLWYLTPAPPHAVACNCASEKACSTNTTCVGDITTWYDWVMRNIPGTKIIVVGVGTSATICSDQLLTAAGGDPTAVYNPQSWAELQQIVQTISATACSINAVSCTDCCGLCTCGVCIPAPQCFNPDKCHIGVFDNSSQCCTSQPVNCTAPACQTASCDNTLGCQYADIQCKAAETCTQWICNATTVVCEQFAIEPPPTGCSNVVVPPCVTDADCNAGDACTNYTCANISGTISCKSSSISCGASDKCVTRYCNPGPVGTVGVGCRSVNTTCNDHNACTNDTCDPVAGCVFTPIVCPTPDDTCLQTNCDPILGCGFQIVNCSAKGFEVSQINCTVPACNKTCYNQYVCAAPPPLSAESFPVSTVLGSALGAAAVVGIVIGAAVLLAGLGTAAGVAIAGAAGAGGVAIVSHNPTYIPSGASGNNVLFKPNDN